MGLFPTCPYGQAATVQIYRSANTIYKSIGDDERSYEEQLPSSASIICISLTIIMYFPYRAITQST